MNLRMRQYMKQQKMDKRKISTKFDFHFTLLHYWPLLTWLCDISTFSIHMIPDRVSCYMLMQIMLVLYHYGNAIFCCIGHVWIHLRSILYYWIEFPIHSFIIYNILYRLCIFKYCIHIIIHFLSYNYMNWSSLVS